MSTIKIKKIKSGADIISPLVVEQAVTDTNGVRLNEKLANLATQSQLGELSSEITTLQTAQGNLSDLTTTAKNNLVAAINEAAQSGGGGGSSTPSGDPMHYLYTDLGAVWNATTQKWAFGEYTDITAEEIRNMYHAYVAGTDRLMDYLSTNPQMRTTFFVVSGFDLLSSHRTNSVKYNGIIGSYVFANSTLENLNICPSNRYYCWNDNSNYLFYNKSALLKKIVGIMSFANYNHASLQNGYFFNCKTLEDVRFYGIKTGAKFSASKNLNAASVAFMINNVETTSAIVITLHADAYARAMADADVTAALAAKTNVSLASA